MEVLKNLKARVEQGHDIGMRDFHSLGISYVTADGTRIEKYELVNKKCSFRSKRDLYRRLDINPRRSAGVR